MKRFWLPPYPSVPFAISNRTTLDLFSKLIFVININNNCICYCKNAAFILNICTAVQCTVSVVFATAFRSSRGKNAQYTLP